MSYYVDIPSIEAITNQDASWINVATFESEEAALQFAMDNFGADKHGDIRIVSSD